MLMNRIIKNLVVLLILISGYVCADAQAGNTPNLNNGKELKRITLQLRWIPQFQFAGYYMAQAKKFYAEEGLDVTIIPGSGNRTQVTEEVLSGRADFGIGNSGLAISSMKNLPVTVVADIFQRSGAVLVTKPEFEHSLSQIQQERLAIRNIQDNPEFYGIFEKVGITPNTMQHTRTANNGYEEFLSNQVDAFNAYAGNEIYLLQKNNTPHVVIDPQSYGISFYGDTIFTHSDFAKNNPDLVSRFVRATIKGWIYALDHIPETVQFLHNGPAAHKSVEHLLFEAKSVNDLIMSEIVPVGQINPKRWEQIASAYKQLNLAEKNATLMPGFFLSHWQHRSNNITYWSIGTIIFIVLLIIVLGNFWFIRLSRRLKKALIEKNESLALIEQMANHDQLTGLPNRRLLYDRIERAIIHAKRNKSQLGVCVIDLNGFKRVNDECGHQAGDQVLKEVANRLKEWIRESDSVGRLGGDEFVLVTGETHHSTDAAKALKLRVEAAFVEPFTVKGRAYSLSFSFGAAFYPDDALLTPELISKADERMYKNKLLEH